MAWYFISDNVNLSNDQEVNSNDTFVGKVKRGYRALQKALISFDDQLQSSLPISSRSELQKYQCATKSPWRHGVIYIEHPRCRQMLIPKKDYNNYILRDIIADIQNYITDHFAVSELVIGFVSSSKFSLSGDAVLGSGIKVPVKSVNSNATFDCELSQTYMCRLLDTNRKKTKESHSYLWIDQFPDIISAVKHGTNKYESIQETSLFLVANGLGLLSGKKEKKVQLYISYRTKSNAK